MPELPDVEVYRRNLEARLAGCRVIDSWVNHPKRTPAEDDLRAAINGSVLRGIVRDGKMLRFEFDSGNTLAVHLMLHGDFYIDASRDHLGSPRITIQFEGAGYFSVSDRTGLATIKLNDPPSTVPDALDAAFDLSYLQQAIRKKPKTPIKALLMDQKVVQGIGNKYSDEILWTARIDPRSAAGKLPEDVVGKLLPTIKHLLPEAVRSVHKMHPETIHGKMREGMKVYTQETTPTGKKVVEDAIGGRIAHYSPDEQVLYE
jgi:formamidopyrimidine-DNA glycosylase